MNYVGFQDYFHDRDYVEFTIPFRHYVLKVLLSIRQVHWSGLKPRKFGDFKSRLQ